MLTFVHHIRENAASEPGSPALYGPVSTGWRQLSRGAWWASVRQAAGGLGTLGIGAATPVLLWAASGPEWAVLWPALCSVGAVPWLVPPGAPDEVVRDVAKTSGARHVVTDTSVRLERALAMREQRVLSLDSTVVFERIGASGTRVVDLDALIERGAREADPVRALDGCDGDAPAAVLPDGTVVTHTHLVVPNGGVAVDRVYVAADPCSLAVLRAIVQAVSRRVELWMVPSPARLVDDLPELEPGAVILGRDGWRMMRVALDQSADDTGGLRRSLVRLGRVGASMPPLDALVRSAQAPVLGAVGLRGAVAWCDAPLEADLADSLAELGVRPTQPGG